MYVEMMSYAEPPAQYLKAQARRTDVETVPFGGGGGDGFRCFAANSDELRDCGGSHWQEF